MSTHALTESSSLLDSWYKTWPEIGGHFWFNNLDAIRNLTRILIRILIPLLGELLVLLTFIELLMNHNSELEYKAWQLMQTSQKAKKGDTEFANSDFFSKQLVNTHFHF